MDAIAIRLTQRGSPFELQDVCIQGVPCKVFPKGPQTLNDIYRRAQSFAQRDYLVFGTTRLSYGETLAQATVLAHTLRQQFSVTDGARVALLMRNCPEWIIAFIAITSLAATAVIIHADSAAHDVAAALLIAESSLLICDSERAQSLTNVSLTLQMIILDDIANLTALSKHKHMSFDAALSADISDITPAPFRTVKPNPDSTALIAFTSGSTGKPKGVVLSHRNIVTGLMNMMLGGALISARSAAPRFVAKSSTSSTPCALMLSPLSHISGYAQLLLMLYVAGKIVLMPRWNVDSAMSLIEREKARSLVGATPLMIKELVRTQHSDRDLSSLTGFYLHGAALHSSLIDEIDTAFPQTIISTGYGMTETCGSVSVIAGTELHARPDSCGLVLPSVEIKLMDEEDLEAPTGGTGEIFVRGAMTMQGYSGATADLSAVINDGWFKTGDLGRFDTDGYLHIVDRLKDVMAWGNKNISAALVERAATSFPNIEEAAALGSCSIAATNEILVAVLAKTEDSLIANALRAHLCACLDEPEMKLRIVPCATFPRTASGKINRNELRQQVLAILRQNHAPHSSSNPHELSTTATAMSVAT